MLKSTLNVTVSIKPIDYSDFRKLVEQVDPEFKTFSRSRYTNVRCFGAVTSRGQLASARNSKAVPKHHKDAYLVKDRGNITFRRIIPRNQEDLSVLCY